MSRSVRLLDLLQALRRHRRPVGRTCVATDPDGHRLRVFAPPGP